MKKLIILLPLIVACNKQETVNEVNQNQDSTSLITESTEKASVDSAGIKDSIVNNAPATKEVLRTGVMRDMVGKQIIRNADASQLPFSIGEEFTEDGQEFVLKLDNFSGKHLKAVLKPSDPDMNIRFNQIKLPDGSYDGPFEKEISIDVKEQGEVWLIIGRSNMASGDGKGHFSVKIE